MNNYEGDLTRTTLTDSQHDTIDVWAVDSDHIVHMEEAMKRSEEMHKSAYEIKVDESTDYDSIIETVVLGEVLLNPRFKNPFKLR